MHSHIARKAKTVPWSARSWTPSCAILRFPCRVWSTNEIWRYFQNQQYLYHYPYARNTTTRAILTIVCGRFESQSTLSCPSGRSTRTYKNVQQVHRVDDCNHSIYKKKIVKILDWLTVKANPVEKPSVHWIPLQECMFQCWDSSCARALESSAEAICL